MDDATSAVRRRAATLWLAVTAGAAGLAHAVAPSVELVRAGATFADLLVGGCSAAVLVATALLWLTTADVAWQQIRSPGATGLATRCGRCVRRTGRIGPIRSLLLAACGVAAVAGPAAASGGNGPTPSLSGLPLPDRATGTAPDGAGRATPSEPARTVLVRPGDSLWAIAARTLGPRSSAADVASYWHRVHALNAATIGSDPDLVQPGQRLRLPPAPPDPVDPPVDPTR